MTLEMGFFNLQMTNLFIGLFSRNALLRPYSVSIQELGYSIHSIEPSFLSKGRKINPEAIACSNINRHTLLTEWTAATSLGYEKIEQIRRYLNVDANELVNNAKITPDASSSCSVWIAVLPTSLESFQQIVDETNNDRLLLCSFDRSLTGEYCIEFHLGSIYDTHLSAILTQTMKFKRIPEGYLPIPLENLRDKRFEEGVVQQVVAFLIRKQYQFSIEDICKTMFSIWTYLPNEKKTAIRNAVKRVMRELSQKNYCKGWLVYSSSNWEVSSLSKSKLDNFLRAVVKDTIVSDELSLDDFGEE